MKTYEKLLARRITLKQDSRFLGKQIKRLQEERRNINRYRKILDRLLRYINQYPVSTFFDKWTEEELDRVLKEKYSKEKDG